MFWEKPSQGRKYPPQNLTKHNTFTAFREVHPGVRFQGFPVFPLEWEGSVGFKEYGFLPEGLINYLALLGWNNESDKERYSLEELVSVFDSAGIRKSGARFDIKKATWINHLHIKECATKKIIEASGEKINKLTGYE